MVQYECARPKLQAMQLSILPLVFAAMCKQVSSYAVSDIVSNYAKVSVNDGTQHNTTTTPPILPNEISKNETEDEIPEYEDFDDNTASPERSTKSTGYDTDTMMKYFNGMVNLLALMYKFNGKSDDIKPQSLHFSKSRPRSSDGLANSVNQLAEDRYNPTTATKKFKAKQGAYSTMEVYPVYNPSSPAETYSSNDGKTSYDADSSQYMINNPDDDKKPSSNDDSYKPKGPMTKYMAQNDPVDIQQSYSYEIPQEPAETPDHHDPGNDMSWHPPEPEPIREPSVYPWMTSGSKKPKEEPPSWAEKPKPTYYPNKKKMKPPMEPMEEDEENSEPWDADTSPKQNNVKDPLYYPWLSSKRPKPIQPPPEEDDIPDDHDASSWGMKPPMKAKPPKNFDDNPYLLDHDDHHGVVFHDDFHHDEEDHPLQDEDRESKRPYTYYHLGRKLWYVPLLFSLYFIVYIGSLILKSIARHKVQFPEKLWDLHDHNHHHHDEHGRESRTINEVTERVFDSIESARNKYM